MYVVTKTHIYRFLTGGDLSQKEISLLIDNITKTKARQEFDSMCDADYEKWLTKREFGGQFPLTKRMYDIQILSKLPIKEQNEIKQKRYFDIVSNNIRDYLTAYPNDKQKLRDLILNF